MIRFNWLSAQLLWLGPLMLHYCVQAIIATWRQQAGEGDGRDQAIDAGQSCFDPDR